MEIERTSAGLFYHATPMENLQSINVCGLTISQDGYVHLTKDEVAAVRYCASTGARKIACFTVEIDDLNDVVEIVDFGSEIFLCKSYAYAKDVPSARIKGISLWDLSKMPL